MKLKTIGYYKEMPHGQVTDPCMEEFINQEDVEQAEMICNYLRNGSALIVSPGETVDILHPEKGFSGTATASVVYFHGVGLLFLKDLSIFNKIHVESMSKPLRSH